jgi:hypothetical protein
MDKDDRFMAAHGLHARAERYRGEFLNLVAVIERTLGELLTEYFCTSDPSKQRLFLTRIAARMSLEEKRTLLLTILQADYPTMAAEQVVCLKDLAHIQNFRNKLAHSVVDVSEEALKRDPGEGVGFVQWQEGAPIDDVEFHECGVCVRTRCMAPCMRSSHCCRTRSAEMRSNRSFDSDTHRQRAARRVDKPTPCGALPVRAGQLRR